MTTSWSIHNSPPDGPQVKLWAVCFFTLDRAHLRMLLSSKEALLLPADSEKRYSRRKFPQPFEVFLSGTGGPP